MTKLKPFEDKKKYDDIFLPIGEMMSAEWNKELIIMLTSEQKKERKLAAKKKAKTEQKRWKSMTREAIIAELASRHKKKFHKKRKHPLENWHMSSAFTTSDPLGASLGSHKSILFTPMGNKR